MVVAHRVCCSW